MNLPTEIFGDVVVVHTPDDLGGDSANDLASVLACLDRRNVVLDLDSTESLGSGGLAAFLDAQERLRALGGDVKIATGNATNRKILEITRTDRLLEVFDSVIDAVKSYQ